MDSAVDYWTARALLEWQVEMGADEAILDAPLNRLELVDEKPAARQPVNDPRLPPTPPPIPVKETVDPVAEAERAARGAGTLDQLAEAMRGFDHCDLKKGARNFVFAAGSPKARVMIIGEAPTREDDLEGRPFAGQVGQLLDRMVGAIGLSRDHPDAVRAVYLAPVLPWRPPANHDREAADLKMMLPFLKRHIELADPDFIVLMGNQPCQALLGRGGINRMRGQWAEVLGKPALPMQHPSALLRNPAAKRDAWADLLDLSARLEP